MLDGRCVGNVFSGDAELVGPSLFFHSHDGRSKIFRLGQNLLKVGFRLKIMFDSENTYFQHP